MATKKRVAANRQNAQRSTGPKTEEGKATVSLNALKHGLSAQKPVLPDEDPKLFQELSERLQVEFQPVGEIEMALVKLISLKLWRLARLGGIETGLLIWEHYQTLVERAGHEASCYKRTVFDGLADRDTVITDENAYEESLARAETLCNQRDQEVSISGKSFRRDAIGRDVLSKLARYEVSLERSLYRALAELRELQNDRAQTAG